MANGEVRENPVVDESDTGCWSRTVEVGFGSGGKKKGKERWSSITRSGT